LTYLPLNLKHFNQEGGGENEKEIITGTNFTNFNGFLSLGGKFFQKRRSHSNL
jgi:hypothetical protein